MWGHSLPFPNIHNWQCTLRDWRWYGAIHLTFEYMPFGIFFNNSRKRPLDMTVYKLSIYAMVLLFEDSHNWSSVLCVHIRARLRMIQCLTLSVMWLLERNYNRAHATLMHPVPNKGWTTNLEILEAEAVALTTIIWILCPWLSLLERRYLPLNLHRFQRQCQYAPNVGVRTVILFTPILDDINRRRAILPFLFGKQP